MNLSSLFRKQQLTKTRESIESKDESKNNEENELKKSIRSFGVLNSTSVFGNYIKNLSQKVEEQNTKSNFKEIFTYLGRKNVLNADSIDINIHDLENRTIVHRACYQLKYDLLKEIENTLNQTYVNQIDIYGNSPLILSCKLPNKDNSSIRCEIIKLLIQKEANIHLVEQINGWSALHWSCFNGDLNAVQLLIENGAIFFLPCNDGDFPIDLAGKKKNKKIVSYLINECDKFLEIIGDFCELDPSECKIKKEKKPKDLRGNLIDKIHQIAVEKQDDEYKKVTVDLNVIPPFTQSVLLRCYINHCLYWACYYNIEIELIQKYIEKYEACSIVI